MKKKQKIIIIISILLTSFIMFWCGYITGYKTAGFKYYYDGMKLEYAFYKVNRGFREMTKAMEFEIKSDTLAVSPAGLKVKF